MYLIFASQRILSIYPVFWELMIHINYLGSRKASSSSSSGPSASSSPTHSRLLNSTKSESMLSSLSSSISISLSNCGSAERKHDRKQFSMVSFVISLIQARFIRCIASRTGASRCFAVCLLQPIIHHQTSVKGFEGMNDANVHRLQNFCGVCG